jgi:hypothetical protein
MILTRFFLIHVSDEHMHDGDSHDDDRQPQAEAGRRPVRRAALRETLRSTEYWYITFTSTRRRELPANTPTDNASNNKLYIPVSPTSHPQSAPPHPSLDNDHMSLDDSKHKVYIYDLDAELASDNEGDSADAKPIFIPDIEKHLNNLPKVMLINDEARSVAKNMQLVLYNVPHSLTVPEERDGVRRVIEESRARMRERQCAGAGMPETNAPATAAGRKMSLGETGTQRYHTRSRSKSMSGALQVPLTPMEHFASRATVNGYANGGYDPDAMDMD